MSRYAFRAMDKRRLQFVMVAVRYTSRMKRWLTWKRLATFLVFSFAGLAACCILGKGNRAFVNGGWGVFVMDAFAAVWAFGLTWILFVKLPRNRPRLGLEEEIMNDRKSGKHESVFYANRGSLPK